MVVPVAYPFQDSFRSSTSLEKERSVCANVRMIPCFDIVLQTQLEQLIIRRERS